MAFQLAKLVLKQLTVASAGRPWQSILVRTGVFRGPGSNSDSHPADLVVNDVEEAVDAALSGNLK